MTMTYDDTMRVIDRLKGGWSKRMADDTFNIWIDELEPLEFSPAYAAAKTLIRTSKYFPAISEFLASYTIHEAAQRPHVEPTACTMCDNGYVLTSHERNEVIPCSRCRREQYDAWASGTVPRTTVALFQHRTPADTPDPIDNVAERIARLKAVLADIAVHPERYQPAEVDA